MRSQDRFWLNGPKGLIEHVPKLTPPSCSPTQDPERLQRRLALRGVGVENQVLDMWGQRADLPSWCDHYCL